MSTSPEVFRFRSRFPEFDDPANDPDISAAIDAAKRWIDPTIWGRDYDEAWMLWAAHALSLRQMQLASNSLGGTGATDLFIRSVGFGERRVQFGQRKYGSGSASSAPGEDLLGYTLYGMEYLMLRARNIPGVATI